MSSSKSILFFKPPFYKIDDPLKIECQAYSKRSPKAVSWTEASKLPVSVAVELKLGVAKDCHVRQPVTEASKHIG